LRETDTSHMGLIKGRGVSPDEDFVVDWQARLAGKVRALENLGKFTRLESRFKSASI